MKVQSFHQFLRNYARSMNSEETLSLAKAEQWATDNSRFLTLMSILFLFDEKALSKLEKNKEKYRTLYSAYQSAKSKYAHMDFDRLNEYVNGLDAFDELRKTYLSYQRLVLNRKNAIKLNLYEEIQDFKAQKKISNYRIYTDLHLNPGNTNDFLKNKRIDKLSEENVNRIYTYCRSAP
jgi:hypothetical protein